MEAKYDIYLENPVDFDAPGFAQARQKDPAILANAQAFTGMRVGFLGVQLSAFQALWIAKILREKNARAHVVRARTGKPEVSRERAHAIAREALSRQAAAYPGYAFSPAAKYEPSTPLLPFSLEFYSFWIRSDQLAEEGMAPPGLFATIDRLTGELASEETLLDYELALEISNSFGSQR